MTWTNHARIHIFHQKCVTRIFSYFIFKAEIFWWISKKTLEWLALTSWKLDIFCYNFYTCTNAIRYLKVAKLYHRALWSFNRYCLFHVIMFQLLIGNWVNKCVGFILEHRGFNGHVTGMCLVWWLKNVKMY